MAAVIGVLNGQAIVGMTAGEADALCAAAAPAKINSTNLGLCLSTGRSGGTTVSATLEIAASAGLRVLATGGIGGVHKGFTTTFDISSDLAAFARYPLVVVCSGAKSLLDVRATREAIETLGVPLIGWRTDAFPAFYLQESGAFVDARFDNIEQLAAFVRMETSRASRGVVVANPIGKDHAIAPAQWDQWLKAAQQRVQTQGCGGRDITPALLTAVADISAGATIKANVALLEGNAALAGELATALRYS